MTDKEKQWEKEIKEIDEGIKESNQDIKQLLKITFIALLIGGFLYMVSNRDFKTIQKQLDVIEENTTNNKVDSLQVEIMELGHKLDSMQLKYDYNYEF